MCEARDDVRETLKMEKLDAVVTYGGLNAGMDHRSPTTAFVTKPKIFGRDAVKERIVQTLMSAEACGVDCWGWKATMRCTNSPTRQIYTLHSPLHL